MATLPKCMYGYLTEEAPLRWMKYNLTAAQYPMGYRYPKFCHGPCMTLSKTASTQIYRVAVDHDWNNIKLEDVLFSGLMRTIANVSSIDIDRNHCRHVSQNKLDGLSKLFNAHKAELLNP